MADYINMAMSSLGTVIGNKFASFSVKVTVENTTKLEATTFKAGIEPPQVVVPVIAHGEPIKGVVEIIAPHGETVWFGGLTVSLRVAKLGRHGGEPEITKEIANLPKMLQPKATPVVHAYDYPIFESKPYVVLEPGRYEAEDGSGLCHWVEANVSALGWRGRLQYVREGWSNLQKQGHANRAKLKKQGGGAAMFANMNKQKPEVEGIYFTPGGRLGDAFQQVSMQVVSPPTPLALFYLPSEAPTADGKAGKSKNAAKLMGHHSHAAYHYLRRAISRLLLTR